MQDRDVVVMFFVGVATSLVLVLVRDTLTGDAPERASSPSSRLRTSGAGRGSGRNDGSTASATPGTPCSAAGWTAPVPTCWRRAHALPAFAQQVDGQVRVLRAARTSIDTWAEHIHHMDMLRVGTLSPEEATRMWLSMWRRGARDLDAYRRVAREAGRLDGCRLVGASG